MARIKKAFFSGSFDLFHMGHLVAIKKAKQEAEKRNAKLIVGINTDSLYRRYKQKEPTIPYKYRKEIVEALKYVDETIPAYSTNKMSILKKYKIDIFVICEEWKNSHQEEQKYMKETSREIIILPYFKGISASEIRDKLIQNYRDHEKTLCDECHKKL